MHRASTVSQTSIRLRGKPVPGAEDRQRKIAGFDQELFSKSSILCIGAGGLISHIAPTLVRKTHRDLVVFNRTRERTRQLASSGIAVADSVESAVDGAKYVVLMLSDAAAITSVLLSGALRLTGKTVVQMGTISPEQSIELMGRFANLGAEYCEAPVLGSVPEANDGKLIVMVGASSEQYERLMPLLSSFGPQPILVGTVGAAAALKLAMNQLIAALTASFALSLGFVQRYGIEVDVFMKVLRASALYAPTFDKKLPRMLAHDYGNPNFPTKHLSKDVALFIDSAKRQGLNTAAIEGVRAIVESALDLDLADSDYSAIFESISPTK
jgi:3-hydroxyisobutyrate dehydrogenase